jgi:hypothetical protein
MHIKVEIQSNSKFLSLTLTPTRSPGPPRLQINVQDAYEIRCGHSICTEIGQDHLCNGSGLKAN